MPEVSKLQYFFFNLQSSLFRKFFLLFTVPINCSSDLKNLPNSWSSALNFKSFSRSLKQLFLTVGQNNFGNKIPFIPLPHWQKNQTKVKLLTPNSLDLTLEGGIGCPSVRRSTDILEWAKFSFPFPWFLIKLWPQQLLGSFLEDVSFYMR